MRTILWGQLLNYPHDIKVQQSIDHCPKLWQGQLQGLWPPNLILLFVSISISIAIAIAIAVTAICNFRRLFVDFFSNINWQFTQLFSFSLFPSPFSLSLFLSPVSVVVSVFSEPCATFIWQLLSSRRNHFNQLDQLIFFDSSIFYRVYLFCFINKRSIKHVKTLK